MFFSHQLLSLKGQNSAPIHKCIYVWNLRPKLSFEPEREPSQFLRTGGSAHRQGRLGLFASQRDLMSRFRVYLKGQCVAVILYLFLRLSMNKRSTANERSPSLHNENFENRDGELTSLSVSEKRETQLSQSAAVSPTCRGRFSGTTTFASLGCISIPRESVSSFFFLVSSFYLIDLSVLSGKCTSAHNNVCSRYSSVWCSPIKALHCIWWFCAFAFDFDSECTTFRPLGIAAAQCTVWGFRDLLLRWECAHYFMSIQWKVFGETEPIVALYALPL